MLNVRCNIMCTRLILQPAANTGLETDTDKFANTDTDNDFLGFGVSLGYLLEIICRP